MARNRFTVLAGGKTSGRGLRHGPRTRRIPDWPRHLRIAGFTPRRTPDEQSVLDTMERLEGRPLTEQEANFAVEQAYQIGDI